MTRAWIDSCVRRAACLLLVAATGLAGLVGTGFAYPPVAAAAPAGAVMRPTTVSARADEIVTVDVLSNDEPPAGTTWDRSSVCLVLTGGCLEVYSVDGFSWSVDEQGTLRHSQSSRSGGAGGVEYQVRDSRGTAWRSSVRLTTGLAAQGSGVPPADGPQPRLEVTQAVSPTTFDHAGQVLTWTSVVTNVGDVALPVRVTDDSSSVSARTCTPVANDATLAPGASTTCTATSEVRQDFVDGRNDRRDAVRVGATTIQDGQRYRAAASATATSTAVLSPRLALAASASPATVSRVGQTVAYTFVVSNRGDVTLRDPVVRAPFPGLSAVLCPPLDLGRLRPGASTTCRATRTTTVADLKKTTLADTAKVTAQTLTKALNATAAVTVDVRALRPVATDDTVGAVEHGPDVFLPGATNDRSAEAGGPAVDPSRTVFVAGADDEPVGQRWTTPEGTWSILPDGSVRFRIGEQVEGGQVGEASYRVFDAAGRSAVGHLRVPVRTGPRTASTQVETEQDQPVTVDVLGPDDPGQDPDGRPSAFDRSSLRIATVSGPHLYLTSYTTDQRSVSVTGVGTYAVGPDARVTFTPTPGYFGFGPTLVYTARSTAGATMTGTLEVDVDRNGPLPTPVTSGPVASDDAVVTTAQLTVPLPAQANDFPGSEGLTAGPVFPGDQLAKLPYRSEVRNDGRELYVTRQGVYDVYPGDPQVYFHPARGGDLGDLSPVAYEIRDNAGATSRANLRVTVLRGPVTRPEYVGTRQNQTVTVDVLANDDPGTDPAGGSPTPAYDSTEFTTVGLPGATTSSDRQRLTVPGQGVYTFNPGNAAITFDPEAGFSGVASEVTYGVAYTVERPHLPPATVGLGATLRVTVRADTPVAHADTVMTRVGHPVVVAVLRNDAAGSSASPLVGPGVRLRLAPGLPAGSTLYGDTKSLVVPQGRPGPLTTASGGGVFLVSGRGEITFVPVGTEPAPELTVGYQVADANGTTTRSTLTVTVSR